LIPMASTKFMTENQYAMVRAFRQASENSEVVTILDYAGSGFKYALNYFIDRDQDQYDKAKISLANIQYNGAKNISIEVMKDPRHIRFSDLNHTKTDLVDWLYKLNERSKEILTSKRILIALDNFERLNTTVRLSRTISILKNIKFKCGIVLRINRDGLDKLFGLDADLSEEMSALISKRIVLARNKPEDIVKLCQSYGVRDQSIIEEVSEKVLSFSLAMRKIENHMKVNPPGQLEINFK